MAHRVKLIYNPNYKRNGQKSYGWLLHKYGFNTTKQGPFFRGSRVHHQGKFGSGGLHQVGKHHGHHGGHLTQDGSNSTASSDQTDQPAAATQPQTAIGGRTFMQHNILMKYIDAKAGAAGGSVPVSAQDIQTDSEYICAVTIGTPPQTVLLDFDTGSSDLWVWSTELSSSIQSQGKQAGHHIFDPKKSSTFKKMSGSTWQIQYGDQSSASGDVGTDTLKVGNVSVENQAIELANKMSTEFVNSAGDGLLGLAWGNINTVQPKRVQTPVENMISQQDIPQNQELFTAYLGSWRDANEPDKGESFYTFGEIDQDVVSQIGQPQYTPIDNSQGFWMFDSTSMTINGKSYDRSGATAIADTGTTLLLTDDDTCQQIYAAIPGSKYDSNMGGWVFPTNSTADQLPEIGFPCGNHMIMVQKEDLPFADAGNNMVYGGIQSRGTLPFDIFGDTWLKACYVVFDQGNKQIGVVQRKETEQNLEPPPTSGGGS